MQIVLRLLSNHLQSINIQFLQTIFLIFLTFQK
jgi:hypothetical protein